MLPMLLAICLLLADPGSEIERQIDALKKMDEPALLKALGDSDWEIVHRAVDELGKRGGRDSVDALVDMAVRGPLRRIRLAAARVLRKLDAEGASERIARRMKGDDVMNAAAALGILGKQGGEKQLVRMLKQKDPLRRRAAVYALAGQKDPERIETWTEMLADGNVLVRVAAVDALVATGNKRAVASLRARLKAPRMSQVMERRYIAGIRKLLQSLKDEGERKFAAEMCAQIFGMAGDGERDARFARLLGSLGRKDAPVGPVDTYVKTLMGTGLNHQAFEVRRASIAALARIGAVKALKKIEAKAKDDPEARVRFHALRAVVTLAGEKALPLVLNRTRRDKAIMVREEAATMCARLKKIEATRTLITALGDPSWEVRTCAAISLGKLRAQDGVEPLMALHKAKDWRLRGAAVSGLGRIHSKKAIPLLITALRDKEPAVAASALEYLRHISGKKLPKRPKPWREWWDKHARTFTFIDRDKAARDAKKYGYAIARRKVYEDMDIVVLATRRGGDSIQTLLTDYGVEHRIIRAASVNKVGLHPYSLFVANCPGEITRKDVERLQWFVRAGGYMFASCWALTHTVHVCFPGVVDKLPLKGQVIDNVAAEPRPSDSPFLRDVFDEATSPIYTLMGSHLIRVLDPERFEVLIDSPETAAKYGDGNLAGWFTIGHGTILDSANHFDLQGMKPANARTEKERMAFAMDHLGYQYAELRKLKAEGVFRKGPIADKRTRDVSIFRFITTFVREKRLADEQ